MKTNREKEFFPTPAWATEALLTKEEFGPLVWEPACGDGAISEVLKEHGYIVHSTDLYDHGYRYGVAEADFMDYHMVGCDIVTNPPFSLAEKFIRRGATLAHNKMALLLNTAFLGGQARAKDLFVHHPPSRVWVISKRITFYPKGEEVKNSGTQVHAWYVWDKGHIGPTQLGWLA